MVAWAALERRLRSLAGDAPLAVVLGGGAGGLSYARSLGRRRIPVLLAESPAGIAGRSRYAWSVELPGPSRYPEEWVAFLERVGACLSRPGILLPANDVLTNIVAQHADRLEGAFRFVVPARDVMRSIVNKRTQLERAEAAGVPIPVTYFPATVAEAEQVAAAVRYPCLFKPYESALGRIAMRSASGEPGIRAKALIVHDSDELTAWFDRVADAEIGFMVQEIVPGDDSALFGYWAFWDEDGQERQWMTKRKVRQFPLHFGSGSVMDTVIAPEVADLSRAVLRSYGYRGMANIEFMFDARDGSYRLIEINPRSSGALQLAVDAGIDFPFVVYEHLARRHEENAATLGFRPGVRWVYEDLDLQAFLALRKTGELTFAQWARSVARARSWAVVAPTDPAPFLFQVAEFLSRRTRRARARIGEHRRS
jgi:predicted ATP-grasp superfamily ATP-dependent carboligase